MSTFRAINDSRVCVATPSGSSSGAHNHWETNTESSELHPRNIQRQSSISERTDRSSPLRRRRDPKRAIEVRVPQTKTTIGKGKGVPSEPESEAGKKRRRRSINHSNTNDTHLLALASSTRRARSFTPAFPYANKHGHSLSRSSRKKRRLPIRDVKLYPTIERAAMDELPVSDKPSDVLSSLELNPKLHGHSASRAFSSSRRRVDTDLDYLPSQNVTLEPQRQLDETRLPLAEPANRGSLSTASLSNNLLSCLKQTTIQSPCRVKREPTEPLSDSPQSHSGDKEGCVSLDSPSQRRLQQYEQEGFVEITKFENALDSVCREQNTRGSNRTWARQGRKHQRVGEVQVSLEPGDTLDSKEVKLEGCDDRLINLHRSPLCERDLKGMHPERARKFFEDTGQNLTNPFKAKLELPQHERQNTGEMMTEGLEASSAVTPKAAVTGEGAKLNDRMHQQDSTGRAKDQLDGKARPRRSSCKRNTKARTSIKDGLQPREIGMPFISSNEEACKCAALPAYFTQCQDGVVHFKSGLSLLDFEMNCEQVVHCGAHPRKVIKSCRRFLRDQRKMDKVCHSLAICRIGKDRN